MQWKREPTYRDCPEISYCLFQDRFIEFYNYLSLSFFSIPAIARSVSQIVEFLIKTVN